MSHTESRMLRNDVRRCRRLRHILSLYTMMPSLSSTTRRRLRQGKGSAKIQNDNIHDIYSIVSVLRSELYRNVRLLLVVLLKILLDYFARRVVYDVVVFANIIIPPSPRRGKGGGCM